MCKLRELKVQSGGEGEPWLAERVEIYGGCVRVSGEIFECEYLDRMRMVCSTMVFDLDVVNLVCPLGWDLGGTLDDGGGRRAGFWWG